VHGKWVLPLGIVLLLLGATIARMNQIGGAAARRTLKRSPAAHPLPDREAAAHLEAPADRVEAPAAIEREAPWPAFLRSMAEISRSREALGPRETRRAILAGTAAFLEFDQATMQAFDATREVVQADLERIQREMGREFAAQPEDLPDHELQRIQSEVDLRYREDREQALSRLALFLGDVENHRRFREFLEVWTMEICRGDP
jgi:hypothetical protein